MNNFVLIVLAILVVLGSAFAISNRNTKEQAASGDNLQTETASIPLGKKLDLSGRGLKSIPASVFTQTEIESLDVSNNALGGAIQAEIRHLQNLKILNASNNQMTGVPAEIGQLQKLEVLDLSNNKLTGLPYELGNLKNLKTLNLSGNNYSKQDLDYIKSKLPSSTQIVTD